VTADSINLFGEPSDPFQNLLTVASITGSIIAGMFTTATWSVRTSRCAMSMRRFTRLTNAFSKKLENHAAMMALCFMYYLLGCIRRSVWRQRWRLESPTMSGPSKKSSPSSGEPENLLGRVERLREQAEAFQRTVEEALRTARDILEELHVQQAKRRRHGRRMD
jgi:hypothetical protein